MEQERSLTVADHTRVMQAVIDRPLNVIHYLDTPRGVAPTAQQFIDAAVQVRAFDPDVRSVLQQAREDYPRIAAYRSEIPAGTLAALEAVVEKIKDQPADAVLRTLAEERAHDDDLAPALGFAEQLVRDGAGSIYSPDYPPAEYLQARAATRSAGAAGAGIVAGDVLGGAIGFFSPIPGGAVKGAVVGSGAALVTAVAIEIFS